MNIEVRQPVRGAKDKARVGIFDCDIHPKSRSRICGLISAIAGGTICRPTASVSATATSKAFLIPRASRSPRGATPGRPAAACRRAISTSCASNT